MSLRYPERDPPFSPRRLVVIDLEATCDRPPRPREEAEIIEIGAVAVDGASLAPIDEFQTFVRPAAQPELTPFCRDLTGIGQADVDHAPDYRDALADLVAWLGPPDGVLWCSWGGFDARAFALEDRRRDLADRLPPHWNLARAFSGRLRLRRRFGVLGALDRVELAFEGRPHRGIDDARNIARLLPWCLGRAEFPPEPPRWVRRARTRAREARKAARGQRPAGP